MKRDPTAQLLTRTSGGLDRRAFIKTWLGLMAGLAGGSFSAGCRRQDRAGAGADIPGIIRREGKAFLFENHNVAYLVWHALGIENATLIHVDTHDDYRHVDSERLAKARQLCDRRAWSELYRLSDLDFSRTFEVNPADQLFDLGNFLYPCVEDGTVSALYWVVPEKTLNRDRVDALARHFRHVLQLDRAPAPQDAGKGRVRFQCGPRQITLCTLDGLPSFAPGALLDVDVDFFAFPYALSEDHLPGELLWDPGEVCRTLRSRVPEPAVTTVCSSVWGGYLPVMYRFLADACFDFMVSGRYPAYVDRLLAETVAARTLTHLGIPPEPPEKDTYMPAWYYFKGLLSLCRGEGLEGLRAMETAARRKPVYGKGLLDAAEAFLHMGQLESALRALALFEGLVGGSTTESRAWHARTLLARGDTKGAAALAGRLVEWDRQPFSLMLYGGVLVQQQDFDKARSLYAEVIRMDPGNGAAYYNTGVVMERQGEIDDACKAYRKALRLRPSFADAHENLGYLLLTRGQVAEAISHFEETVRLSPLKVKAWGNLGRAYSRQGAHKRAAECLRRALGLNADMAELHFYLARELAALGDHDEAVSACRNALKLKPGWSRPAQLLAELGGD